MNEKMVCFYNDNALNYDLEQEEFSFVRVPEWEIVLSTIKKVAKTNHSLLEIGAGTGRFTLEMAPLVKQVTAIDISQNMLEIMAQKIQSKSVTNITPICSNFMDTDFNRKFDIIASFSALEYILDTEALLAKLSNLLAPGGHLIITTAHDTFFRWWGRMGNYYRQGIFMNAFSKKKMRQLVTTNGMEMIEITDLCLKSYFSKGILLFVHATKQI